MDSSLTPKSLGKYQLIASLGGGGMAQVYLGLMAGPAGFNKLLVIKVLREEIVSATDESASMFWDEARLAARLVHPNIVQTYEGGEVQGRFFLAMEYLDGQAYRFVRNRLGPNELPLHEELRILSETARGLHYSHELKGFEGEPLGVVHRDVSPQNVFITYDGQVKLLDFGIAKTHDAEHRTQIGVIKGKLDYIAPEQLRGDPIDRRADIFALGVMLWEAITGQRFAGGRKVPEVAKVHARVTGGEPRVRAVRPDIPAALANIVDRALALDPEDRWQDAATLADALDAYIESSGQKPSAKSLSEIVSTHFEAERVAMHKLIEQQVNARRRGGVALGEATLELPRMAVHDTRSSVSAWPPSAPWTEERPASAERSEFSDFSFSTADSLSNRRRDSGGDLLPNLALSNSAVVAGRGRMGRMRLLVGVLVTAMTAGGLLVWFGSEPKRNDAVPTVPLATKAPASEPASAVGALAAQPKGQAPLSPSGSAKSGKARRSGQAGANGVPPSQDDPNGTISLILTVLPPHADVKLDQATLFMPFSGRFWRDEVLHRLEATADGYRPYRRLVSFDRDQRIEILMELIPTQLAHSSRRRAESIPDPSLSPAPAPAPEAPSPPSARLPMPGDEVELPSSQRTSREQIDTVDPYATMK